MRKRLWLVLVVTVTALAGLLSPGKAHASGCSAGSPESERLSADVVLVGRVLNTSEKAGFHESEAYFEDSTVFEVNYLWKGQSPDRVTIITRLPQPAKGQNLSDGVYPTEWAASMYKVDVRSTYVVYAYFSQVDHNFIQFTTIAVRGQIGYILLLTTYLQWASTAREMIQ